MGDTDRIFKEVMTEGRPTRGKFGKQSRRRKPNPQQSKSQPNPQTGMGDDPEQMSHEQATLMAFMGIARRVMGDLETGAFNEEMLEVLDKVLVAVDEAVRDQKLKAQYGDNYRKYRKDV